MTETSNTREAWGSRAAFVLAAIGSAVGLGNLWGFPYKLFVGGGGAFLIPYLIAMVIIGLPLLIMEFSVGHWAQNSPPGAFGQIVRKYRFVGWWLVALAFVIITYYVVILGYSLVMLWDSILGLSGKALPWASGTGADGVEAAKDAFFGDMLGYEESLSLGALRAPVVIGMLISWALIYFCLFRGVKWVSKVVLITVPLPWLMLFILAIRGVTLDGATTGLSFYLNPDWSKLAEANTWRLAFSQVFFSLSLGFAVMLSYASFLHRKSDLNNNAAIIGLGDLATSFIAGIAVFATLGNMAMLINVPVDKAVAAGPGLAFAVYPYALAQLPTGAAVFSLLFFAALLTLGIDSAFSIVEAVQASINDNKPRSLRKSWVLPVVCLMGAAISLIYTAGKGGLNWLGLVDDQINGPFGILSVALAECLVVGYAWKGAFIIKIREHANERSDWNIGIWWDIIIRYVAPFCLLGLICWSISDFVADKIWLSPELLKSVGDSTVREGFAWDNKIITLYGYIIFIFIPVLFFIIRRSKKNAEDRDKRKTGPFWHLFLLPAIAAVLGAIWGLVRLSGIKSDLLSAETTSAISKVTTSAATFETQQLGNAAYVVLAVAFLIIFGGLTWCFWKAMQAAGKSDPELLD
jgi:NSS family neurotransmitter:Na+ symporter